MNNPYVIILLISFVSSSSSLFICVSFEENLYSCKHFLFHDQFIVSASSYVIPNEEQRLYSFMNLKKKNKKTNDEKKQQQNHPSKDDNFYLEVLEKYTKFYKRFHPYSNT